MLSSLKSDAVRIGLVSWDYAVLKGGMGRSFRWIGEMLLQDGYDVHVLSADDGEPLLSVTRRFGGHVLFSLLLPFRLRGWIRRHACSSLLLPVGPGGVLFLGYRGVPYDVVTYHTYAQQKNLVPGQRWKAVFLPMERRMFRRARHIFCFCDSTADVLRSVYGIPAEKIIRLPHAVDTTGWGGGDGKKDNGLCVCIARLEARKGVLVLLKAWEAIHAALPHARLIIVGDGAEAHDVDKSIAALGSSVRRVPALAQEDLRSLVRKATVAVCPSYLEGFGLAAAEAMMAGTTLVATDTDGLADLVTNEQTGLLVPPGNADALGQAIMRLLQDDALCGRLARQAQERARHRFDPVDASHVCIRAFSGRV